MRRTGRLSVRLLWTTAISATAVLLTSAVSAQAPASGSSAAQTILTDLRRDSGQTIAPVFEGWEPNPDGTISMYFGYMNRNWKEELDIDRKSVV